jgi:transposase
MNIKEYETVLSKHNSKTVDYDMFKNYCIEKNKLNNILYQHYQQNLFRKLKFNRFINTQKSEAKMIKNFASKFGKPENTIFVLGDWDKGNYHMKGLEPTICKKFRRIFKNAGYKTFLINEFRTSKLCNYCHNELEKFMIRPSKKPKLSKENKNELVNGLLRCQSVKPKCEIIHNRDKNAVINMLSIVKSVFNTGLRPKQFTRDS